MMAGGLGTGHSVWLHLREYNGVLRVDIFLSHWQCSNTHTQHNAVAFLAQRQDNGRTITYARYALIKHYAYAPVPHHNRARKLTWESSNIG